MFDRFPTVADREEANPILDGSRELDKTRPVRTFWAMHEWAIKTASWAITKSVAVQQRPGH